MQVTENKIEDNNKVESKAYEIKKPIQKNPENYLVPFLLTFTGGFLDAYTYNLFDGIFVNAQTGNLIHLSIGLLEGDYKKASMKLLPVIVFFFSIFVSRLLIHKYCSNNKKKWVELLLIIDIFILLLIGIGFFKQNLVLTVSAISFVCASMVTTFRKIDGGFLAPTMSTGNLRAFSENISNAIIKNDAVEMKKSLRHFFILIIFCTGVIFGMVAVRNFGKEAIFFPTIMFLLILNIVNRTMK